MAYGLRTPRDYVNEQKAKKLAEKLERGEELTRVEEFEARNLRFGGKTISYEHLLIALVVMKLSKTPQGLDVIKTLGKEFIRGIFDTMHSLGQAAAANKVTSWANPYLVAMVLDRFGFINPAYMLEFKVGLSLIAGATVAESFLDNLQGIFPFSKCEPSEYPSNIVFSARQAGVEVPEKMSWTELTDLMKTFPRPRAAPRKKK